MPRRPKTWSIFIIVLLIGVGVIGVYIGFPKNTSEDSNFTEELHNIQRITNNIEVSINAYSGEPNPRWNITYDELSNIDLVTISQLPHCQENVNLESSISFNLILSDRENNILAWLQVGQGVIFVLISESQEGVCYRDEVGLEEILKDEAIERGHADLIARM